MDIFSLSYSPHTEPLHISLCKCVLLTKNCCFGLGGGSAEALRATSPLMLFLLPSLRTFWAGSLTHSCLSQWPLRQAPSLFFLYYLFLWSPLNSLCQRLALNIEIHWFPQISPYTTVLNSRSRSVFPVYTVYTVAIITLLNLPSHIFPDSQTQSKPHINEIYGMRGSLNIVVYMRRTLRALYVIPLLGKEQTWKSHTQMLFILSQSCWNHLTTLRQKRQKQRTVAGTRAIHSLSCNRVDLCWPLRHSQDSLTPRLSSRPSVCLSVSVSVSLLPHSLSLSVSLCRLLLFIYLSMC